MCTAEYGLKSAFSRQTQQLTCVHIVEIGRPCVSEDLVHSAPTGFAGSSRGKTAGGKQTHNRAEDRSSTGENVPFNSALKKVRCFHRPIRIRPSRDRRAGLRLHMVVHTSTKHQNGERPASRGPREHVGHRYTVKGFAVVGTALKFCPFPVAGTRTTILSK